MGKCLSTLIQEATEFPPLVMRQHVGADISTLGKFLMAALALERLLACVSSFMSLSHVSFFAGRSHNAAVLTLRLPCCEKRCPHEGTSHTCIQDVSLLISCCILANHISTYEWLFTGMRPFVNVQMCLLGKSLATVISLTYVFALLA